MFCRIWTLKPMRLTFNKKHVLTTIKSYVIKDKIKIFAMSYEKYKYRYK